MRVLVTGIDGFVGSHAAELLLEQRVEVHGVVLETNALRNIAHLTRALTLHEADITDGARMISLMQDVRADRILHIAGQAFVPASLKDPMTTFQVNLLGGLNILEATRMQSVARGDSPAVLVVASGEAYGRLQPHQIPVTEDTPLNPTSPYGASKASLDMISQQYATCFGLNVTVVRPFNHVGPRQDPSFVVSDFARQFAQIAAGHREPVIRVGNIAVQRDFTDVRDVVRAYWSLFDRTSDEIVFNVASGKATAIRELLDLLREISGLDVQIQEENARIRKHEVPIVAGSYERLHKATGWTPRIPLRQTVRETYEYWLDAVRGEVRSPE